MSTVLHIPDPQQLSMCFAGMATGSACACVRAWVCACAYGKRCAPALDAVKVEDMAADPPGYAEPWVISVAGGVGLPAGLMFRA